MPELEIRTAVLTASGTCAFVALMLYSAFQSFPKKVRGIQQWAIGAAFMSMSGLLLGLREIIPDLLSVNLGNLCYLGAVAIWVVGCQRMFGIRSLFRSWIPMLVVASLLLFYFTQINPQYPPRLLVMACTTTFMYGKLGILVIKHAENTVARKLWSAMLFAVMAIAIVAAIGATYRLLPGHNFVLLGHDYFSSNYQGKAYVMSLVLLSLFNPIGFFLLITQQLSCSLDVQAHIDFLTGLLNRRALFEALKEIWDDAKSGSSRHSVIMVDLDDFKKINDTFSHEVGDMLLQHFANIIRPIMRSKDTFARIGGEEFVVVLPNTDNIQALACAQRIQRTLKESIKNGIPEYTCSIGIATQLSSEEQFESLLKRADSAMYCVKRNGKNGIDISSEQIQ